MQRKTVSGPVAVSGLGVVSGQEVRVCIEPAGAHTGITFAPEGTKEAIPAVPERLLSVPNCTAIGRGGRQVALIEHLMAAFAALGVTDARVVVAGAEIPLLDGSAQPFLEALHSVGTRSLGEALEPLVVTEPVLVSGPGDAMLACGPGEAAYTYCLQHPHPRIGCEIATFRPAEDSFAQLLAPARTFSTEQEARALLASGAFRGGSEANSVIVFDDHLSAPQPVPCGFARHKLVDLIGDLWLLGRPVVGRIVAFKTGHAHNHELVRQLAARGD